MKKSCRIVSWLLLLVILFSVPLVSCHEGKEPDGPDTSANEYREPLVEGYNQVTFYWNHSGSYENCDIWVWWEGKGGSGYRFYECDYGAKAVVNVPEGIEQIGFLVRKNCSDPGGSSWGSAEKDFEQDRFAFVEGRETFIYLKAGVQDQFKSNDGGKTLEPMKKITFAGMMDEHTIQYRIASKAIFSDNSQVKIYADNREVAVVSLSTLGREATSGYIVVDETLDLTQNYRIEVDGYGVKDVIPTGIFDSEYFAQRYHYEGTDLGATIHGDSTIFKVWAPTASRVVLNLFEAGHGVNAYKQVEMVLGEKGVWSHTESCGHGTYYTYSVTTTEGTQEAVDPYAKAAGVNGDRSMVVDLALTNPHGWETDEKPFSIDGYSEAIIWEVHVRDFSGKISSSRYQGKYLAFTETGLLNEYGQPVGIDYLKTLGITHVHLLPVYDYATVDESDSGAPFNWGYDPKNYNVPEGSYSTDPYNGAVRIKEFKQMVMALHDAGIGVVMDMVYNHTYDANSSFNKIVPYYYYRYTSTGENSSASGCGNDTASERYMFGKFMIESTAYWVDEYNLDGLRFDLMGLHDLATMQGVERAVHTVNPEAILYGEGWTMGATIDGSAQANQTNISKIVPTGDAIGGIAVFNDVIRDGLKGSVFEKTGKGYINGSAKSTQSKVLFGIRGGQGLSQGWSVENAMVVNYMSAHDNNTLWDKLLLSNPNNTDEERARMNRLGAAILMISRGTPFWQAGEELLRTKGGDENSYQSSDAVNNIDWSVLRKDSLAYETMLYYKGLIEMRKAYNIFYNNGEISHVDLGNGAVAITFSDLTGKMALAVINPNTTSISYTLDGEWNLVADADRAGQSVLVRESGTVTVGAISLRVYVNDALIS